MSLGFIPEAGEILRVFEKEKRGQDCIFEKNALGGKIGVMNLKRLRLEVAREPFMGPRQKGDEHLNQDGDNEGKP